MTDEPAETLQQGQDRQRHLVVLERVAAVVAAIASIRAAVIGSPGEANGSLSMTTQLNCSPTTSTPCQNDEVANNTACGVTRN